MSMSPTIHRFTPGDWRIYRDLRLRALAESPDAFGSTWAFEQGRTDAEWRARIEAGMDTRFHLPLVARLGEDAIGLAWGRIQEADPTSAHLYQVWVAPEHRGRGVGRMLLDAAIAWSRQAGARYLDLDVTCGDTSARRLYARAGFAPRGDVQPLRPGSALLEQPMRLALMR